MTDRLKDGEIYRNKRGDLRGPMWETAKGSAFIDQHGVLFHPNGQEFNHTPLSTANIDLSTAGARDE
jgi:hypothetical protein